MTLDPVHDLQKAFRKILAAMASPGTVVDLGPEAEGIDLGLPLPKALLLVALTLLDAETSFSVASSDPVDHAAILSRMTYSRIGVAGAVDFAFSLDPERTCEAISTARTGNLVDPQLGATVVAFADFVEAGGGLELSGPGIATVARLAAGLGPGWVAARSERNREFPLGVDLLIVDHRSRLAALPRTTLVREVG